MSYRVEIAKTGRATCRATECKKHGIKIDKNDLRLGIWVDFGDRGASWTWRHWGCVTGYQLQNMRDKLEITGKPGTYDWDALDGYDGDDKGSLQGHPELQEKVRRVITQGFIDPEDWNGDPEMNKLGEKGMQNGENKKKIREEVSTRKREIKELKEQVSAVEAQIVETARNGGSNETLNNQLRAFKEQLDDLEDLATPAKKKEAAPKKRGHDDDDEEGEAATPAKKKRATKAKKEVDEDGEEVKPAPKKRATKAKKEEFDSDGEEVKPAPKKSRAKKAPAVKEEDAKMEDTEDVKLAPAKKSRAKKVPAVKEEDEEMEDKPTLAKKPRARKSAVVKEEDEEDAVPKKRASRGKKAVKDEPVDDEEAPKPAPAPKRGGRKKASAVKDEPVEDSDIKGEPSEAVSLPMSDIKHEDTANPTKVEEEDEEKFVVESQPQAEEVEEEEEEKKPAKGRAKKTAATNTTRTSRSRTSKA